MTRQRNPDYPDRSEPARGDKRVTLRQVAASLGLSPTTVSLVLNRTAAADSIPPKTQRRVFAAAEKLGYRPDLIARSLRSRRSSSVGVLVPEISDAYVSGVLGGVENKLLERDYLYLIASHRSRTKPLEEQLRALKDRLVDGLILVATPLTEPPGLPAVSVAGHNSLDGVTNVVIDHDRAAILALSHLADLGHERIAFFKGPEQSADTETRWQSILAAADLIGLEVRPKLTLQLGGSAVERRFTAQEAHQEGYAFGRKLLQIGVPFSALFAFNDISAIGAMRAFLDAGVRVPEDVSVIGFDDIQAAAFQNPGLTTVRQPLIEMGEAASKLLLQKLAGSASTEDTVTMTPDLVVRESTGPAPAGSRRRQAAG